MTHVRERGLPIVDCMVSTNPGAEAYSISHIPRDAFRDDESIDSWPAPTIVSYLFKGATGERYTASVDAAAVNSVLDEAGIAKAVVTINADEAERVIEQLAPYGDRWAFAVRVDPHRGMKALRELSRLAATHASVRAVVLAPHATYPTIPPNSKEYYPVYAKCVELDLAAFVYVGIPGPRVPGWSQDPITLDEVCWFFPDLKIVMKHGGEPWVQTCVKLMLKWPNLFYATSGFAPKHYPREIIEYANTRGTHKILFSGYWPIMSYADIFDQLSALPLRDKVWEPFLYLNANRVLGL